MVDMAGFTSMTFGISTLPRTFKPAQSSDRKFSVTMPCKPTNRAALEGYSLSFFARQEPEKAVAAENCTGNTLENRFFSKTKSPGGVLDAKRGEIQDILRLLHIP